jgi:hypothetical protein
MVDGRGAARVAQAIINLIHVKSNEAIQLS